MESPDSSLPLFHLAGIFQLPERSYFTSAVVDSWQHLCVCCDQSAEVPVGPKSYVECACTHVFVVVPLAVCLGVTCNHPKSEALRKGRLAGPVFKAASGKGTASAQTAEERSKVYQCAE